jgi:hypothetical protein
MSEEDFEIEPVKGLPEAPPEGEELLWQGSPDPWLLARHALGARAVAIYFIALALIRGGLVWSETGASAGIAAFSFYLFLGAIAVLILLGLGRVMAKTTVYTITSHRVAMRIGVALTVTLNLPYRWIETADLAADGNGHGDIMFDLKGETKLSYLVCWPHVRPWKMAKAQPAFRCIKEVRDVAGILGKAAKKRVSELEDAAPPSVVVPAE